MISPSEEDILSVLRWLDIHGVVDYEVALTRDLIRVKTDAVTAEKLLNVDFQRFQHVSGRRIVRAVGERYSVPANIAQHIELIGGVHGFSKGASIMPIRSNKNKAASPMSGGVTPAVVRKTFNVPSNLVGKSSSNLQAIGSFLQQYISPDDLALFQKKNNLPSQRVAKIVGPNDASNPGMEAQLDIEYITALGSMVPTWVVSFGDLHENQEPFLEWATFLSSQPDGQLPLVNSVSYGDDENTIDLDWARRVDAEFQKLAVRGVSILFASGDSGVGCNKAGTRHVPTWPAQSPYVTAVGGVAKGFSSYLVGDSISSGGFSNYYSRPDWQASAVANYLSKNTSLLPPASFYNATSRAAPDVAAFSEDVIIVINSSDVPIGGTSCACPMFAGMVSLLNDALLQAGKKPLGFLNPLFYKLAVSNPNVFTDVVHGSNPQGRCEGFRALPGWDPVTGNGVLNFQNMLSVVMSM